MGKQLEMDEDRRDFYRYHGPHGAKDGPGKVTFTDGEVIGACSIATVFAQVASG